MRYLCDPPEDGGRGMRLNDVLDMTLWQLALFCVDKKTLRDTDAPVLTSFREARHFFKQQKQQAAKAK